MTKKHASTLRFLDFRSAFVGIDALEMLFRCCTSLEEFYISAGPTALVSLIDLFFSNLMINRFTDNIPRTFARVTLSPLCFLSSVQRQAEQVSILTRRSHLHDSGRLSDV